jgi:hypothetical protein
LDSDNHSSTDESTPKRPPTKERLYAPKTTESIVPLVARTHYEHDDDDEAPGFLTVDESVTQPLALSNFSGEVKGTALDNDKISANMEIILPQTADFNTLESEDTELSIPRDKLNLRLRRKAFFPFEHTRQPGQAHER